MKSKCCRNVIHSDLSADSFRFSIRQHRRIHREEVTDAWNGESVINYSLDELQIDAQQVRLSASPSLSAQIEARDKMHCEAAAQLKASEPENEPVEKAEILS